MPNPPAQIDPNSDGHEDIDGSAEHALSGVANPEQEQAGVILRSPEGKYFYTSPTTSPHHDSFEIRVMLQKGWQIAGIYHSHPGKDDDGQVFSPQDLQVAQQLNVPSYIKFMKDGAVRKYIPGETPTQNRPDGKFQRKVASGDALKEIPKPMVAALSAPPASTPEALTNALKTP